MLIHLSPAVLSWLINVLGVARLASGGQLPEVLRSAPHCPKVSCWESSLSQSGAAAAAALFAAEDLRLEGAGADGCARCDRDGVLHT